MPDVSSFTEIRYEVADRIATITLHRPDRLNAFTLTMCRELVAAADAADADDDVRVVILTGEGRGFCAGADLEKGAATFDEDANREPGDDLGSIGGVARDWGGVVTLRFAALRKPLIAAVNGVAVGVGATMTLPADVRIASEAARFGFVFARRGIVYDGAASWFLPRVVGVSQASEWVLTGRVFDSAEALAGRLVSRVVPADELLPTARALAAEIAENTSGVSVALCRRLTWSMLDAPSPWEAHRIETAALAATGKGPDAAEGVMSFLEKRPAAFSARVAEWDHLVPDWPVPPADHRPPAG
ncbi:enoyl-CoA hydratase-related protein [Sporichthya polymorpha]|uniref:enoyl-CoA hydratase-related protein n=1 Tax=Sporichthya polymorpha TaxID=35751 RepID=UPI00036557C4|nr:enoyl-CoA hydratase-related protein [Sporichthya polymorpha]